MNYKIIVLSLGLMGYGSLQAQKTNKKLTTTLNQSQEGVPVRAKILDQSTGEALEYATATILNAAGKIVDGTISDSKGKFNLSLKPGDYQVKIEFISYKEKLIPLKIEDKATTINLGTIYLAVDDELLSEVVLEETANQLVLERDKKVFNVGSDKSQTGNSALEVMDQVPSVEVDPEGTVSMRGNENVRILIDGKPSSMLGSDNDGLKNIPAELIDKIEIITNPSSKYEADTEAGILNIILKKNKKIGLNGNVQVSAGLPESGSVGVNLAYRDRKWNIYGGYNLRHSDVPVETYSEKKLYDDLGDITLHTRTDRENDRKRDSHSFNFGTDFYLNKQTTFGISTRINISDNERDTKLKYNYYTPAQDLLIRRQIETEDANSMDLNFSFDHKFHQEGHTLSFDAQISHREDIEKAITNEYWDLNSGADPVRDENQDEDQQNDNVMLKLDYAYPVSKDILIEFGMRLDDRTIDLSNTQNIYDYGDDDNERIDFGMFYEEIISASYLTWSHNLDSKYSYSLGLRAEHSDIYVDYTSIDISDESKKDYLGLFPSLNLNFQQTKSQSWQFGLSRKIRRPRFYHLMPFFSTSNNQDIFGGNPDLNPSYSTNMELQYLKYTKKGSFTAAIFSNYRTDVIQRLSTIDPLTGNSFTKPENAADRRDTGMEFFYSSKLLSWWNVRASISGYYFSLKAYDNFDLEDRDDFSYRAGLTNTFSLPKKWSLQARYNFRSGRDNLQGSTEAIHSMDLSMNKDLGINKDWTFSARLSDVFNSRKRRMTTESDNFYLYQEMQWRPRSFTLSLSYRFNQKKKRNGRGSGGGDMDEEMMF